MKKSKAKKSKRKLLEAQIEKLWILRIRERDQVCRHCGSTEVLQCHHIRSRRHSATKYDLTNGILLCRRFHFLQKANPADFYPAVIDIIGQDKYNMLKQKSMVDKKWSVQELELIKIKLGGDE